jgi:hypothetical protein
MKQYVLELSELLHTNEFMFPGPVNHVIDHVITAGPAYSAFTTSTLAQQMKNRGESLAEYISKLNRQGIDRAKFIRENKARGEAWAKNSAAHEKHNKEFRKTFPQIATAEDMVTAIDKIKHSKRLPKDLQNAKYLYNPERWPSSSMGAITGYFGQKRRKYGFIKESREARKNKDVAEQARIIARSSAPFENTPKDWKQFKRDYPAYQNPQEVLPKTHENDPHIYGREGAIVHPKLPIITGLKGNTKGEGPKAGSFYTENLWQNPGTKRG